MAIDIIYRQKVELERLLTKKIIPREGVKESKKWLDNGLIKVITGPRRAGKSIYGLQLLAGENFGYLNFDSEEVVNIRDHGKIMDLLEEAYPSVKYYFFDEIQNLPKWEFFVNTMQRRGHIQVITGSNAKLLSGDLATHLTGRYYPIEVSTFSFNEYLAVKGGNSPRKQLVEYLKTGGYPELVIGETDSVNYLDSLREATVYKDIVKRYKVKYAQELSNLVRLLSVSYTKQISLVNIGKTIGIGSYHTINKYLDYLFQTYLFIPLERFSFKTREQIKLPKKVYFPDTGFNLLNNSLSPDWGRLMENAVFLALVRQGYRPNMELFYYQTRNGKEVDFVIKKGLEINQLIQVCYDLTDLKTKKRELSALEESGEELKCQNKKIITMENLGEFL